MYLWDIVSKIHQQLEQIDGNLDAIQLNCKTIVTLFLWTIWFEISAKPQQSDEQLLSAQPQSLELWDQVHIANPALAEMYLDVLLECISVGFNEVTVYLGSEQIARVASLCLLRVLSQTTVVNNIHQNYTKHIPRQANFKGLLCYHTIQTIHTLLSNRHKTQYFGWIDYKPCAQEYTLFANTLVHVAYRAKAHQNKVPRWILRFVLHSLSLDPLPPTSIIADCLSIIAIDMGCNVPITKTTAADKG